MVVAPRPFSEWTGAQGFSLLGKTENNEGHGWLIHKSSFHLCLQRGAPAGVGRNNEAISGFGIFGVWSCGNWIPNATIRVIGNIPESK